MSRLSLTSVLKWVLAASIFVVIAQRALGVERVIEVRDNQLVVDGVKQPQLFGAEVQYFRLRGGYGPNIPRAEVLALWSKALDHFVQAKMNAISFYIPWDFHEYAEGKFDFTGTADSDLDGRADYPSRDLRTFLKMITDRGITRIMVRPGPYINAEWGFLGFGAIPSWFHDKYPNSHMQTPFGLRSRLYDYHNPDLARHTALWFKALKEQVLNDYMGPGKPIIFLQLDNETNFQWQSIYNHDFSQSAIVRYQDFLNNLYRGIDVLNEAHGRQWDRWGQVLPPIYRGRNITEDQDWYQFADHSIYTFLAKIRNIWSQVGIEEPQVLFTLAESYNASPEGLLPNYILRNAKGVSGLMTVNLYPKTVEEPGRPLLNSPFKADLDVKAADEANDSYLGSHQEWVMGPEIQAGWWRGTEISPEARQQTYLTVLGHGLKAFFVYYFNEGQNWDVEWSFNQIKPFYEDLLWERHLQGTSVNNLPENFWNELQSRSDRNILAGFDVRNIMKQGPHRDEELFFDAPLNGQANPSQHYFQLQKIGENVISPHQEFLARSLEVQDEVAIVKDSTSHRPVADQNISSVQASADWTGGLLGYLMNASLNPRVLHGELSSRSSFDEAKALVHLDTGLNAPQTIERFKQAHKRGQTLINFLASDVPQKLGINIPSAILFSHQGTEAKPASVLLTFYEDAQGHLKSMGDPGAHPVQLLSSNPVYQYDLDSLNPNCMGILYWQNKVVGYRCQEGRANFNQIGAMIFEDYNTSAYAELGKPQERVRFLRAILKEAGVVPMLQLSEETVKTVAFARKDPERQLLWVTVKTGSKTPVDTFVTLGAKFLTSVLGGESRRYGITELLSKKTVFYSGAELLKKGFGIHLEPNGSAVYVVKVQKL